MDLFENISSQEKVDFVNNLSLLIRSGKPINESFELLAKQNRNPALKKALEDAKEKTEKGTPIHKVFEENRHFGNVFVSFIRAGERSGTLDKNLEFLANWLQRNNRLKKEISSATLYPKIIISFALILGAGLAVFVLPQLLPIFNTLDVELPFTTRFLLWFSDMIQENGIYILLTLITLGVGGYFLFKIKAVKNAWDALLIELPVVGPIAKEYQLTIVAQLISTLFRSGVAINESLDIISSSVTNMEYEKAINQIQKRVEKGTEFAEAMEEHPDIFPSVFISVVATGEQTGSYGDSFEYLANFFAERVSEKTQRLPIVIEPILLIGIGIFVAFVATAIIMPIYDVTSGIY